MKVDSTARDWDRFVTQMHDIHPRNTVAWANDATGMDLADQIDPAFRPVPGLVPGWSRRPAPRPTTARPTTRHPNAAHPVAPHPATRHPAVPPAGQFDRVVPGGRRGRT